MRRDNKVLSFVGRSEGNIEALAIFDQPLNKDIAYCVGEDGPRFDEAEGNVFARDGLDQDYTNRRYDHETWEMRKITHLDYDNLLDDEPYHINVNREPENPDQFGDNYDLQEAIWETFDDFNGEEEN